MILVIKLKKMDYIGISWVFRYNKKGLVDYDYRI